MLDQVLVAQGLQDIQHDEDQVAGPGHWRGKGVRGPLGPRDSGCVLPTEAIS